MNVVRFLFLVIRLTTPLIFGALAAAITRKAGLQNMAVESMMLSSALIGVLVSAFTQNIWFAILMGIFASILIAMVISVCGFILKCDLYLVGIAMNTGLVGATVFVMYLVTGSKANTASVLPSLAVSNINIPLIKDIPIIGEILSGHSVFTYLSFLSIALVWVLIYRTKIGLRIRSVGENPQAAESVGISPRKIYFLSFGLAGLLSAFGGMFMSMSYLSWFARDMIAGRGMIAMSAMNIASGEPVGSAAASFMFGAAQAFANQMQLWGIPAELINAFPYFVTIFILFVMSLIRTGKNAMERK